MGQPDRAAAGVFDVTTFVTDLFVPDGGVTSLSQSFDRSTGNYVRIYVFSTNGVSVTSISYGAQTPTLISGSANGDIVGVYELLSPAAGSQTVTVNFDAESPRACMYIVSRSGVHASAPSGTPATATAESNAPSVTVTSASGQLVEGFVCISSGADGVASGGTGQTERENQTNWVDTGISSSAVEKAGASSVQLDWTTTNIENPIWFVVGIPVIPAASGGTVNTQTASDTVATADGLLGSIVRGRLAADSIVTADGAMLFYSRMRDLMSNVVISEGPTDLFINTTVEATSEIVVADDLVAWFRLTRLAQDNVTVIDELIASTIGYLIFSSVLTSNVSVTDEALKTASYYRLMESNVVTADQILRALLVARDLLDSVAVSDSTLTAMQRFILLTDAISLEDSLAALYIPETGPAVDNPIIRIGSDQPEIVLGGYGLN